MNVVLDVLLVLIGVAVVGSTLASAVRTVVLPRAAISRLTRVVFFGWRAVLLRVSRRAEDYRGQDAILALHAPMGLLTLPLSWATGIIAGFVALYLGTGQIGFGEAWVVSGSSFTTLGFARPEAGIHLALSVIQSLMGLGIIALLISYLPSIYGSFQRREVVVADVALKSGGTVFGPGIIGMLVDNECLERLDEMWDEWERWLIELGESHTSEPSLNFLRSPQHDRSWLTTAAAILDVANLRNSALALPMSANARTTLQAGTETLRHIGTFFAISDQSGSLSLSRKEFDRALDDLAERGAPLRDDRNAAWAEFSSKRIRYDTQVIGLCGLVMPPPAPWSADRPAAHHTPSLFARRSD